MSYAPFVSSEVYFLAKRNPQKRGLKALAVNRATSFTISATTCKKKSSKKRIERTVTTIMCAADHRVPCTCKKKSSKKRIERRDLTIRVTSRSSFALAKRNPQKRGLKGEIPSVFFRVYIVYLRDLQKEILKKED